MFPFLIFLAILSLVSVAVVDRVRLIDPPPAEKTRRDKVLDFFTGLLLLICNGMWFGGFLTLLFSYFYDYAGPGSIVLSSCSVVWIIVVGVYLWKIRKSYILAGMITGVVAPFVLFGFCFLMFSRF